ncbi:MAG TPA: BON domain-containing protein [Pirellulales bacterium]|jgi:hyperosmotically inducible protein|nr:BON domain-containing protein [Pirellulales bacterium]
MRNIRFTLVLCAVLVPSLACTAHGQGPGEKLGEKIDRGVERLGSELRQGWAEIRRAADRMGVQARVYARLHWDKMVQPATIDIEVEDTGVVVLKGNVSTTAAKDKARQLAQDTVGVTEVIDHLAVAREAAKE